jgi:hypothetical protein
MGGIDHSPSMAVGQIAVGIDHDCAIRRDVIIAGTCASASKEYLLTTRAILGEVLFRGNRFVDLPLDCADVGCRFQAGLCGVGRHQARGQTAGEHGEEDSAESECPGKLELRDGFHGCWSRVRS